MSKFVRRWESPLANKSQTSPFRVIWALVIENRSAAVAENADRAQFNYTEVRHKVQKKWN